MFHRHRSIGIYTTVQFAAAPGNYDAKRAALDLDLLLILGAPLNHAGRNSTGIWGVNRQGCRFSRPAPWMARGGGPPNHWRITGTPSLGEVPSGGARAFCLLLPGPAFRLFKSEPPSGRNPRWPLPQEWICTRYNSVACQVVIAGKPAPTFGTRGIRSIEVGCQAVFAGKPAPTFGTRGIRSIEVGCQAVFAGKPAHTLGLRCVE